MNCQEITRIPLVERAIKNPGEKRLLNEIFNCIYSEYQDGFINLIMNKNTSSGITGLREMAEDAFQEGLAVFYTKAKEKGLNQMANLKTIIFTFGLWQFLALKKKRKPDQDHFVPFDTVANTIEDEDCVLTIGEALDYDEICWDDFLKLMLSEKEFQLHKAIRLLSKDKWQKAIYWSYFDGIKSEKIALKLNVSVADVHNKLCAAKKELRKILTTQFNFKTA